MDQNKNTNVILRLILFEDDGPAQYLRGDN